MQGVIVGTGSSRPGDMPAWMIGKIAEREERPARRPKAFQSRPKLVAGRARPPQSSVRRSLPDLDRALVNPSAVFSSPAEIVRHPLLSHFSKREILLRWAWDEYLLDTAGDDGMPDGPPSRLGEVRAALLDLGEDWDPHPAAPAAFAFAWHQDERLSLAA